MAQANSQQKTQIMKRRALAEQQRHHKHQDTSLASQPAESTGDAFDLWQDYQAQIRAARARKDRGRARPMTTSDWEEEVAHWG